MSDTQDRSMETEDSETDAPGTDPAPGVAVVADEEPDDAPAEAGTPEEADALSEAAAAEEAARLEARLEAVLFSSDLPLSTKRFAALLNVGSREILEAIDHLNVFYAETGRAFRISPLAGGFQLVTTPEHADILGKLHKERVPTRLSRAALETLSIIAFKQPVTRSEVDAIRGVSASDRVLRHLIERKLVRISGRAEAPGRPLLYGTTREFLGYFGLSAVSDLPRTDELEALLAGDVPGVVADDEELAAEAGVESPAGIAEEVRMEGDVPVQDAPDLLDRDVPDEDVLDEDALDADSLAGELLEESQAADLESHSGEESDDHEGIPSPQ